MPSHVPIEQCVLLRGPVKHLAESHSTSVAGWDMPVWYLRASGGRVIGLAAGIRDSETGRQGAGANRPLRRRPDHGGGDHDGSYR